jgi:transposase
LDLHEAVTKIDQQIEARFLEHHHAGILLSMPGFGTLLAAEFLPVTRGDITAYDSAARLAGAAGLARPGR